MPMNVRVLVRRAFPYLVIAVVGFALAYVIVFVFILPSKIVPPPAQPYHPDSSQIIVPDTSPAEAPIAVAPPVGPSMLPPALPQLPVDVPDLVGMALPDARGVLNTLQLNTVVLRDTSSIQPPSTILRQSPAAGTKVSAHGTVTVTASYFPPAPDSTQTSESGTERAPAESPPSAPQRPLPPIQPEPDTQAAPQQQ